MRHAIGFLLLLFCAGCDSRPAPEVEAVQQPEIASATQTHTKDDPMRMWARSCALCHVDGNAGAPRVGNREEWLERIAQGRETMLQHTVDGLRDMPPLGYCMACERDDFLAMIDFMTAGVEPADGGAR